MVKYSVKKPYTVLVGVVLILVLGYVSFTKMTTDLMPNMSLPYAVIMTTDVGASPEEIETDISSPIEASMATTSNIKNVNSTSYNNYSVVMLEYAQDTDMNSAIIEIQQKLEQIKGNWDDSVGSPIVMQLDPDLMPVMIASADIKDMSQTEISDYVKEKLVPALESVEGVAQVTESGNVEEKIDVTMNQQKIDALNDKIQKKINEQFKEAQEKVEGSEKDITDGKSKLENGTNELGDKIGTSTNEIINNKIELSKQEKDLENQLKELKTNQTSLSNAITSLNKAYDGAEKLEKQITQMNDIKAQLKTVQDGAIRALLTKNPNATNEEKQQVADLATKQTLSVLKEKTGLEISSEEQLDSMLATMENQMQNINQSITSQASAFQENGVKISSYKDIPAATATLSKNLTQMKTGITQIETALDKIEKGQVSLDDALETVNKTQITSIVNMSKSSASLDAASSKIEDGKNQLEEQKESAKDAADLDSILTVDTLNNILKAQNFSMPAGYAGKGEDQHLVRVGNEVKSEKELKDLVLMDVGMDGIEPIRLSDVADVKTVMEEGDSYSKVNGNPAVMLSMQKQTGYSTGDVSERVKDRLDSLEKENKDLHLNVLMDQGIYINIIVDSVLQNMIIGAILAVLVLLLFLKDIRPTLVIACAIPLSVVFAIVLMYFTNVSLNVISLSGLALGIGMLVDNSIVVIENIYRLQKEGATVKKAAVEGARQVAGAIIASTITTICVFAPIIFTDGITRQMFVDIALTIAFTLSASLIIALTFVPMMAAGILKKPKEVRSRFLEKIKNGYESVLRFCLRFKPIVFIGVIVLLIASVWAAVSQGFTFMDMNMDSGQISVTIQPKENQKLSFEQITDLTDEAVKKIQDIKGIDTIGAMAGGSGMSVFGNSTDTSSLYILLDEKSDRTSQEISKEIEKRTKDLDCQITTDASASNLSAISGNGLSIQVKGPELDKLQELAGKVGDIVRNTKGTTEVNDGLDDSTPSFTVVVDKEKAAKYNLTVAQVFQAVSGEMAPSRSTAQISTGLKDYDIYVQNQEQRDVTVNDLKKLKISYKDKKQNEKTIALSKIAEFKEGSSLNSINRKDQTRFIAVSCMVDEDHNVTLLSNKIQKEIDKMDLPEGYSIEMAGEDKTIMDAMQQLVLMLVLAVVFIYLVMVAQFQSLLSPFIIMFTIPLAFTGGLFALFFSGNEISVVAMIGFVMLAGIIVNNGIVMVDYINQLRREGLAKKEAIVEAGRTRLRPILMTALTTILAMSTMAIGIGSGSEMMQPMAIVTIGGLIYGTLLTLIAVPCIYDAFHRNKSLVEEEL